MGGVSMVERSAGASMIAHALLVEEPRKMHMALETHRWTRADLDRLPEDGNTYEVIGGELFVTPPPSAAHQEIVSRLLEFLLPYIVRHKLGRIHVPRSVIVFEGGQAEPDLMVLPPGTTVEAWERMPAPLLVVEVLSRTTSRRDRVEKRSYYLDAGVSEYWIVDREAKSVTVIRRDHPDDVATAHLRWQPSAGVEPLLVAVAKLFST
jgi:Uma2 family endonuclease